jgi:DNA-3-methyladenine glycosylase I
VDLVVRERLPEDLAWIRDVLLQYWRSTRLVSRGKIHQADCLPGIVAVDGDQRVGLLTYETHGDECEIVSLNALNRGQGIGTALIEEMKRRAGDASCRRLWLITTNDNIPAMRFYESRGFQRVAVHRNAVELSRRLKPEIPLVGVDGVPIRDEVEYQIEFQ